MHSRVTRKGAAALAAGAITVLAAGCAASSSSSAASMSSSAGSSASAGTAGAAGASAPAGGQSMSAHEALDLAAQQSKAINSYAATMSITGTQNGSNLDLSGTLQARVHPSVLLEMDVPSFTASGQTIPGGIDEIVTPSTVYLKLSSLTQALGTSKPWAEMSMASASKSSGMNLSSLVSQAQGNSPLTQTQMLATSDDVRAVGHGVIGGAAVTEYSGSYSLASAVATLPAALRSQLSKDIKTTGITTAKFQVWIDGQHLTRRMVVTETGSAVSQTVTETITSINQPVTIQLPPAADTYVIPAAKAGANNPS